MRAKIIFLTLFFTLTLATPTYAQEPTTLTGALNAFKDIVGHSWKTKNGNFEDIQQWRSINQGNAILIEHSVNQGSYAGTSLVHLDPTSGKIIFRYATTAHFFTNGTITPTENGYEAHEIVTGGAGGVTEVKSGATLKEDTLYVWSSMKTKNGWSPKEEIAYKKQ